MEQRILELSDVTSFHHYGDTGVEAVIQRCQKYGRPVLCTEWLRRVVGQTVELILPVFARERIGWYNWGLGRRAHADLPRLAPRTEQSRKPRPGSTTSFTPTARLMTRTKLS